MSLREARQRLLAGELSSLNRIYDETVGGWIEIGRHPSLQFGLQSMTITAPVVSSRSPALVREWYYLQGQAPIGAFTYLEMIRLLQFKKIGEKSILWKTGMLEWAPKNSFTEFHPSTIGQILHSGVPGIKNYFSPRKFNRISFKANFIIHDEEILWRAQSSELSPGGMGLMIDLKQRPTNFKLGQELFIHQTSRAGGFSINARGVICCLENGSKMGDSLKLGLEFVDISKYTQIDIAQLVRK